MKTFLGLPIYINYNKISEEDYVALTRKRLKTSKGQACFQIALGIFLLLAFTVGGSWLSSFCRDSGRWFPAGLAIGFMVGMLAGQIFLIAMWLLYHGTVCLQGNRTDRLLIKYYDHKEPKLEQSNGRD